ncbi:NAD(P)H-binding protein [Aestuariibaculum sp. M13]|uniref:NAD(P)H-binding protein n=1 Tax=Aestuariibaculum sp. M13 TaxID=2967132 RepID=UPI002159F7E5|nr:NAD(P)H-binding protein [Aestuariibaculum sp. M13]MCR8667421.1 NAD(P)H-binding protein [Aestuariibaculum sp. M13]
MKEKVLVIGANGAIAQHVIKNLAGNENMNLTLFARKANGLSLKAPNAEILQGDVFIKEDLDKAIEGKDVVYANLSGPMDSLAKSIVDTMEDKGVKRLIFVTSLGIYDEIPGKFGEWNNRMIGGALKTYRRAADTIETSELDYTVVRPSWLTDKDEVAYETTQKGEPFIGTEVSRKAVAEYITDLIQHPDKDVKASVGVNKPGVYGDKPAFY